MLIALLEELELFKVFQAFKTSTILQLSLITFLTLLLFQLQARDYKYLNFRVSNNFLYKLGAVLDSNSPGSENRFPIECTLARTTKSVTAGEGTLHIPRLGEWLGWVKEPICILFEAEGLQQSAWRFDVSHLVKHQNKPCVLKAHWCHWLQTKGSARSHSSEFIHCRCECS